MRVLLIEDDSATAQSIELMLKVDSFNVYTTDLGEEGIDLGKIYDYDIILLATSMSASSIFTSMKERRRSSAMCDRADMVAVLPPKIRQTKGTRSETAVDVNE